MVYKLIFKRNKDIISLLLRLITWSRYSHVGILCENGVIWEVNSAKGVHKTSVLDFANHSTAIETHIISGPLQVMQLIAEQENKPYDYNILVSWFCMREWRDTKKWVCSELIAWAFEVSGVPLVPGHKRIISPKHLLHSIRVK